MEASSQFPVSLPIKASTSKGFDMSYLLISTQVRMVSPVLTSVVVEKPFEHTHYDQERGPTIVGDKWSDPLLMQQLNATSQTLLGNDFPEYRTDDPPRVVLDKLSAMGYFVVGMTGIGQTCAWTLFKPANSKDQFSNLS
jgi:hypothetical protein